MPRGGAQFSSEELVKVLSHYDIGVIEQVRPLSGGNRRAPKTVFISEQGKFLLKRRPKGKDDLSRVTLAHAVQCHLAERDFPVTSLMATRDGNSTILQVNNHIYELFRFVTGVRYDGSAASTAETGRRLADFHRHLADFNCDWQPLNSSFHDSSTVRRHLKTVGTHKVHGADSTAGRGVHAAGARQSTTKSLLTLYNESSIRVNRLGFDGWRQQVVHGDWHPGNMLFSEGRLVAVLDFDSIRIAPAVTDLANGMLQFSIIAGRPNPADWPDYFDRERLFQFLSGYREALELDKKKLESLVDLMIETMIAEAVLPVAATGFFGHHSGHDFLKMIVRKAEWLSNNSQMLTETIAT
jgi:Ser/Thr protein kinase RdoA (MazF antagonist)